MKNRAIEQTLVPKFASDEVQPVARCARAWRSRDSVQRGAGAPLAGMRTRSRMWAHCYEVESRRTSPIRSPYMGPLFRRAERLVRKSAPRIRYAKRQCGTGRTRQPDAFAPEHMRACTHLHGGMPKVASVLRSGSYTSSGTANRGESCARYLLCRKK